MQLFADAKGLFFSAKLLHTVVLSRSPQVARSEGANSHCLPPVPPRFAPLRYGTRAGARQRPR
jgi:hypothetical protein